MMLTLSSGRSPTQYERESCPRLNGARPTDSGAWVSAHDRPGDLLAHLTNFPNGLTPQKLRLNYFYLTGDCTFKLTVIGKEYDLVAGINLELYESLKFLFERGYIEFIAAPENVERQKRDAIDEYEAALLPPEIQRPKYKLNKNILPVVIRAVTIQVSS